MCLAGEEGEADSWNKLIIKLDVQYSQKDKDEQTTIQHAHAASWLDLFLLASNAQDRDRKCMTASMVWGYGPVIPIL